MPLAVSEDIREEDYDSLFVIQYKSFAEEVVLSACYPGGLSDSARSDNVDRFVRVLGWKDTNVAKAKVIDEVTGDICAFATIRIYEDNPFLGKPKANHSMPQIDEPLRSAVEWVFNTKADRRREFEALQVPGPYGYLQALGTDPARQRQGAATLLVDWAVRIIDERGLRAMVEASKIAAEIGLYSNRSFETIDTYHYRDEEKYPGFEGMYIVTMVKQAQV